MLPVSEVEGRAADQACATHCPYCSLQCGMHVQFTAPGPAASPSWTVTERDFPTNRGGLCQKGWTAAELLGNPDRLRTPLVRDSRSAPLRPATWEEALERIVAAIERAQQQYGRDGVGSSEAAASPTKKPTRWGNSRGSLCALRSLAHLVRPSGPLLSRSEPGRRTNNVFCSATAIPDRLKAGPRI